MKKANGSEQNGSLSDKFLMVNAEKTLEAFCQCVSKCVVSVFSQEPERCVSFTNGVVS